MKTSDSILRSGLIKLASENPSFRPLILPLLTKTAADPKVYAMLILQEAKDLKDFIFKIQDNSLALFKIIDLVEKLFFLAKALKLDPQVLMILKTAKEHLSMAYDKNYKPVAPLSDSGATPSWGVPGSSAVGPGYIQS